MRSYTVKLLSGGETRQEIYNSIELAFALLFSCIYKKNEIIEVRRCYFCD